MQVQPPIFNLHNAFLKSLARAVGQKIPKEVAEIITIDLTPANIEGDFTFSIFGIARLLKINHSKLALDIAEGLKQYKKYVGGIKIVNGYINVHVKQKEFYSDSLRYVINENLLQEISKGKKVKKVLLISEQIKTALLVTQPAFQFVKNLYASHPYVVKAVSTGNNPSFEHTRSFLQKAIKSGKVKDFGNNVIALHLAEDKYQLLQKQDKTPTSLLHQLVSLDIHIKKNKPVVIIFLLDINSSRIYEFLSAAQRLRIIKEGTRVETINNSDIENRISSDDFKSIIKLHKEIRKILQDKLTIDSKKPLKIEDSEMIIARFISYAPEIFRRSLLKTSPKIIISYNEVLKNPVSQLYQYLKKTTSPQKSLSKQLLLQAIYKIIDTSLRLTEK